MCLNGAEKKQKNAENAKVYARSLYPMRMLASFCWSVFALFFILLAGGLLASQIAYAQSEEDDPPDSAETEEDENEAEPEPVPPITADHSKFDVLKQPFADATEVTSACLTCHTEGARQLHETIHWNWEHTFPKSGIQYGKRHIIDNNVLSVASNEAYCATCHNGYGFAGEDFDFNADNHVDCLSCHDTTGTYDKLPGAAGHLAYEPTEYPPGSGNTWQPPDLNEIAQNVGATSRETCGSCHFGARNTNPVIHGNLPAALADPSPEQDVHMGTDYLSFSCSSCHEPDRHQFFSSHYQPVSQSDMADSHRVHATCISCHDRDDVHDNPVLTQHTERVACQSCHIPDYARSAPTMVSWDWSQAGRTNEQGGPLVERNAQDLLTYHGHYGAFEWQQNVTPAYIWFSGAISYTQVGDTIDPSQQVALNELHGSADNPDARLWPTRTYQGIIPYDAENNTLVAVHLAGEDQRAYWNGMDWEAAIATGMEAEELPYSGSHDFVATEMSWLLNHNIAPADQAVKCGECHSRDGRLAQLDQTYLPGRDFNPLLDSVGWGLAVLSLAGVLVHGSLRIVANRRKSNDET